MDPADNDKRFGSRRLISEMDEGERPREKALRRGIKSLDDAELMDYVEFLDKTFYLWHISDLKIYDKPKELWEFKYPCPVKFANYDCSWGFEECKYKVPDRVPYECDAGLTRPPQSWCYIEE